MAASSNEATGRVPCCVSTLQGDTMTLTGAVMVATNRIGIRLTRS